LGDTDLGSQGEGPAAGGRAARAGTLRQQRPQGLAGARVEDGRDRMGAGRLRLQGSKTALVACLERVADGRLGAAQSLGNPSGRLALGTGEQDLAAAYSKGGRRPETGLQGGPLVRQEWAYISRCLHVYEYTTCSKTFIGIALGRTTLIPRLHIPRMSATQSMGRLALGHFM
jgi:hypothetical protein